MKTALVTGATRGIGLALAKKLVEKGFKVSGIGSSLESCATAAASDPEIRFFPVDLSQKEEIKTFVHQFLAETGVPDLLINNAGKFLPGSIGEEEEGVFEELMAVNLSGPYHLTRGLLPGMKAAKSGTIVNICSTASIVPYPNGGSYCISKFGLLGFSKVLREELKPFKIRVISVLPGAVLTDSWAGSGFPESRFIDTDSLAELVVTACTLPENVVVEEVLLRPFEGDIN
jgi:NAD(P)-dependent dehydrogenase (short-subunit alcohol dehydrogenase family)